MHLLAKKINQATNEALDNLLLSFTYFDYILLHWAIPSAKHFHLLWYKKLNITNIKKTLKSRNQCQVSKCRPV